MTSPPSDTDPRTQHRVSLFDDNRGIAFTIEAVLTSLLLLSAVAFAATQLPENPGEKASDQAAKTQLQQDSTDMLAVARDRGDLKDAGLYWDDSDGNWEDASGSDPYVQPPNGHPLELPLESFYTTEGVGLNINVIYQNPDGTTGTKRMFYQGTPGPGAVVASQTVIIQDDDQLADGTEVQNSVSFYAPDAFPNTNRYNTLRIQLVIWD